MRKPRFPLLLLAAAAAACGGGSTPATPNTPPSTTPTPAPAPTPPPVDPALCTPKPPALGRMNVEVLYDVGFRKVLDATPLVGPDTGYCASLGYTDGRRFCPARLEGDPLRPSCDALLVGRATDTGRLGPTWNRNGRECEPPAATPPEGQGRARCVNHGDSQFLVYAFGSGDFAACAAGVCGQLSVP